jgi:nicotinate-nucleotide adenylyltransferase
MGASGKVGKAGRVGLMGGTFDPIHNGHLIAAEEARWQAGLEKIIFVPTGQPPHKEREPAANPWHRYLMTALAVNSNPYFQVSSVEIERTGPSYTVDTLKAFAKLYPGAEIFFITGSDAILEIATWKDVQQLLSLCRFIAAVRPRYGLDVLREKLSLLPLKWQERILCLEVPGLDISSTEIRKRIREGRPVKYLLPESVEDYIRKNGLYR